MATDGNGDNLISLYIDYNGQLLQQQDRQTVSDFIIYFNIFSEFDNVEDLRCSTADQLLRSSRSDPVAGQRL